LESLGIHVVSERGRRIDPNVPNQDDFVVARRRSGETLLAVLDGHGQAGHKCAAFARATLPELLLAHPDLATNVHLAIVESFAKTHALLLEQDFDTESSGATVALALVQWVWRKDGLSPPRRERWLFCAHCGDCRVVLASRKPGRQGSFAVTALTTDHVPNVPEEQRMVVDRGGTLIRRSGGQARVQQGKSTLAMTRAIGLSGAPIGHEPEMSAYQLRGDDRLLVLGTDGLFELTSNKAVMKPLLCHGVHALDRVVGDARRQWEGSSANQTVDDVTAIAAQLDRA
jgi:serine/threonine protein phosphatase PrpC